MSLIKTYLTEDFLKIAVSLFWKESLANSCAPQEVRGLKTETGDGSFSSHGVFLGKTNVIIETAGVPCAGMHRDELLVKSRNTEQQTTACTAYSVGNKGLSGQKGQKGTKKQSQGITFLGCRVDIAV